MRLARKTQAFDANDSAVVDCYFDRHFGHGV